VTARSAHSGRASVPRWDSSPQSQHTGGRRPAPWTVRPPGPAILINYCIIIDACYNYTINVQYSCYISNKGFLEECGKEEDGFAATSCLKGKL
jgi:hypothetical protein